MSSKVVSFRDQCYARLVREFVLVALCRTFFGCPSGSRVKPTYRGIVGIDLGLPFEALPRFFEGDRSLAVRAFNNARASKNGTPREPKLKMSEEDDRYIRSFLMCYTNAFKERLSESDLITNVNSIQMNGEAVKLDVILRRHFQLDTWVNFFVNVLSTCSYDLAFGTLGRENEYSAEDIRPQFLFGMGGMETEESLSKKKTRVRRKESKPKKKKANEEEKAPVLDKAVFTAPVVFTGVNLFRFKRLEALYRARVPLVSRGELDPDTLLAVGFSGQIPFPNEIIRAWIESGENPEVHQFLTNAGF